MTPLERAARALCLRHLRSIAPATPEGSQLVNEGWPEFVDAARAVLTAIREPSEGMLYAAACADTSAGYCGDEALAAFYTAMIDAMLAEGE
jgi:hypothetical protein